MVDFSRFLATCAHDARERKYDNQVLYLDAQIAQTVKEDKYPSGDLIRQSTRRQDEEGGGHSTSTARIGIFYRSHEYLDGALLSGISSSKRPIAMQFLV